MRSRIRLVGKAAMDARKDDDDNDDDDRANSLKIIFLACKTVISLAKTACVCGRAIGRVGREGDARESESERDGKESERWR